jgi:hypothetical protein
MSTTATPNAYYSATEPVVFVAFELREKTWKLGCPLAMGKTHAHARWWHVTQTACSMQWPRPKRAWVWTPPRWW